MKWTILTLLFSLSCVQSEKSKNKDVLANTKKLFKEGHQSLYNNGAFEVPGTHVLIIPPGPKVVGVASELAGIQAKASFLKSLRAAADSVFIVADGTKTAYRAMGDFSKNGTEARRFVQGYSRPGSKLIILKSSELGKEWVGQSWNFGQSVGQSLREAGAVLPKVNANLEKNRVQTRKEVQESADQIDNNADGNLKAATQGYKAEVDENSRNYQIALLQIVSKVDQHVQEFRSRESLEAFSKDFQKRTEAKNVKSDGFALLVNGSFKTGSVKSLKSFENANEEVEKNLDRQGYTLSYLKALVWVTKGILWDSILEPAGKVGIGSVGYVLYNGVAYPALLGTDWVYDSSSVAVEVIALTGKTGYQIVAPTISAALGGTFASIAFLKNKMSAGSSKLEATAIRHGKVAAVDVASYASQSGVFAADKVVHYIVVQLTTVVGATGAAVTGSVVLVGGGAAGSVAAGSGEVIGVASDVTAKAAGAAALVAGTAAAMGKGAVLGIYEVGKTVVVPSSLALGSGIVLTYGSLMQLSAQTILGAADAAYLVLSMEGPNFVIYSIRGVIDPNKDYFQGAVVDLEKLRVDGEVIKKVPATQEEIKKIVEAY